METVEKTKDEMVNVKISKKEINYIRQSALPSFLFMSKKIAMQMIEVGKPLPFETIIDKDNSEFSTWWGKVNKLNEEYKRINKVVFICIDIFVQTNSSTGVSDLKREQTFAIMKSMQTYMDYITVFTTLLGSYFLDKIDDNVLRIIYDLICSEYEYLNITLSRACTPLQRKKLKEANIDNMDNNTEEEPKAINEIGLSMTAPTGLAKNNPMKLVPIKP